MNLDELAFALMPIIQLLTGEDKIHEFLSTDLISNLNDVETILKFVEDRKITLYVSTKELDKYINSLAPNKGRTINIPKENIDYDKVHLISTSKIIKTDLYIVCNSRISLNLHRLNNEMTAITPHCFLIKLNRK